MTELLVLFDVDGTLVHVAEDVAFARALGEHCGGAVDLSFSADMVVSDDGYVRGVLRRAGLAHGDAEVDAVLARFSRHLSAAIAAAELPVRSLPGAEALLTALRPHAALALATGCIEASARAKLAAAGLAAHFPCGGFSRREQARAEILARAMAAAAAHYGRAFARERVVYVGDGVWDVAAAASAGVRFVGVNEDPAGRARLQAAGAAAVFSDLQDVAAWLDALRGGAARA